MINFLKGIVIGIGGVSPGLSGSVLLVIFGLYTKTVEVIANIFKNFKKNLLFLLPLFLGMGVGIVLFGKIVDFFLDSFEIYTRYAFLGLVIGTIPLFYREVRKREFKNSYYILIVISFICSLLLFTLNKNMFPLVTHPNILQSSVLGFTVAGSSIIPGVDSAIILSALGLYELYVKSIAELNFTVLIPAGFGLAVGVLLFSYIMNKLLNKFYGITFSVIFGLFLAIIPSILNGNCTLGFNIKSFVCIILIFIGMLASYFFGKLKKD